MKKSLRFLIYALGAAAVAGAAAASSPLNRLTLSAGERIAALAVPLAASFLFFFLTDFLRDEPSVFRSAKRIYCIGMPFALLLPADRLFSHDKAAVYSDEFFGRFFPLWAGIWLICTAAIWLLMKLISYMTDKAVQKGGLPGRLLCGLAVMFTPQRILDRKDRNGRGRWVLLSVCTLLAALGVFIGTVAVFLGTVYSNMEFEAILFTLRFAAGGLAIEDIISGTAIVLVVVSLSIYIFFQLFRCFRSDSFTVPEKDGGEYTFTMNGRKRAAGIILSVTVFAVGMTMFSVQTRFIHYLSVKAGRSTVYENYYVKPDESVVSFPGEKRSLIFIFLESIENSYASKDAGGAMDRNYLTELTALANEKDSVSFSNTELLGGPSVFVPSITFTQGSTVAQTSGISLNTQIFPENGRVEYPDMIRLEDILHNNGYNQLYIEGSKGEFSMYDKYVGRYEECILFDRITAAEQGYTDDDAEYIWKWGIEDRKLIEISKQLITDISKKDKPFFVTMYTMDTHTFESGHRCPDCDSSIGNDYLAAVDCSSRQVTELVNWIKQQPFYENTTVILIGDHLGNEHTTEVSFDRDYTRTTYNCIINAAKEPVKSKERSFSSLDMFPTTLSAIGAEIKGGRLGLGTDLFSETPTLCEELGEEEYKLQLERTSDYYRSVFCGAG